MRQPKLYIGDSLVDILPTTVISYSVKKFDPSRPSSRFVEHSNRFKVPPTENNKIIFGYADSEKSRTAFPYRLKRAKLVDVAEKVGTVICSSYDDGFNITFFENAFDIFTEIDGKLLSDILPIANSAWTEEEMDTNRAATDGLIAAIIHFNTNPATIFDSKFFLPSFFYHTLVKKTFEFTGVNLSGNILTDARFTDLIVPFPSAQFTPLNDVDAPAYHSKGSAGATTGSSFNVSYPSVVVEDNLLFLHVISYGLGTITVDASWDSLGSIAYPSGTPVVVSRLYKKKALGTETGTESVSRSGHAGTDVFMGQIYQYSGDANITIEDSDNSIGDSSTITLPSTTVAGGKRTLAAFVANINSTPGPATPSGYVESATDNNGSNTYLELNTKEDTNSGSSTTAGNGSANGWLVWHVSIYNVKQNVNWNQYLNEIKCNDLLKDFFTRFFVIPQKKSGILFLKTIEEIIADKAGAVDWSEKQVKSPQKLDFQSGYAQINDFNYTDNKDFVNNEALGRGSFTVDDLTLKERDTVYQTFFENCKTENTTGHLVARIPIYNNESLDAGDIQEAPGKKLLTIKSRTSEPAITFDQTARTDYKLGYFVDDDLAKDTGWQYFLDQFYPSFISLLQRYKKINKYYRLDSADVLLFDNHKMVYDTDGYYLVVEIRNYVAGNITMVTLLKIW